MARALQAEPPVSSLFYKHWFWELNVGPQTCRASALSTEPSLQSRLKLAMSPVSNRVFVTGGHLFIPWRWGVDTWSPLTNKA